MKKDASALCVLLVIAVLSFLAPSAPEPEPLPEPEPPAVVETAEATNAAKASGHTVSAEAVGGLAIIAACGYAGFRLAQAGERRKHRNVITTDKAAFVALMRRLETMSLILENATTNK